ncbi:MAG: 16S rRNA (uracil(1498)-N(3))-methyltransferase [bacterium]|nr:16S rRNA (uracil(1498)-N(3))-methyltransferase [bacterium]
MAPRPIPHTSRDRRFYLDPDSPDDNPRLADQELHHALHVNRLGAGDRLWGLDGKGRAQFLEVTDSTRRGLTLKPLGESRSEPRPGTPGAPLAHLEIGLSLPKPGKAEEMIDRLTQLGVARLQPLTMRRSADHARKLSKSRTEKLERAGREAMKQCLRLWPMELGAPMPLTDWLAASQPTLLLDPRTDTTLARACADHPPHMPLRLLIGPEGGFHPDELQLTNDASVQSVTLKGHILRIETAAELAGGMALQLLRPRG